MKLKCDDITFLKSSIFYWYNIIINKNWKRVIVLFCKHKKTFINIFRLFFENTLGWSTVNVYYWGTEKDPVWPGSAASRLGETNVYYIDI